MSALVNVLLFTVCILALTVIVGFSEFVWAWLKLQVQSILISNDECEDDDPLKHI